VKYTTNFQLSNMLATIAFHFLVTGDGKNRLLCCLQHSLIKHGVIRVVVISKQFYKNKNLTHTHTDHIGNPLSDDLLTLKEG